MDVIQYKCPNCGGDLKFDPGSGQYACEYCRSIFSQEELDRQTKNQTDAQADSQRGEGTGTDAGSQQTGGSAAHDQTAPGQAADDGDAAVVYTCPSCGATIVTDSTTAATFCYYCHNPVVLSGRLDGTFRPDYVLPFKIDRKKAEEIFGNWIAGKKYVPKYFYSKDQIEKFTGVYFPYLMYTCTLDGNIEGRAVRKNVYMQGDREYTETDTYHVRRRGGIDVKQVMRNALKKANKVLSDSVLPFETEGLKPFNMSYLSGFFAEKRDTDASELEPAMKEEVVNFAVEKLKDSLAGYTDIDVTADNVKLKNGKWEYALFPVWTLTYNDSGKIYYFSINGQTGKTVGELPVDRNRLIKTFFIIFIPFALLLLLFFYFIL